jgi:hypothetical protein
MSDIEVELVAQELARLGGASWEALTLGSAVSQVIANRYRKRARLVIAALDRQRQLIPDPRLLEREARTAA